MTRKGRAALRGDDCQGVHLAQRAAGLPEAWGQTEAAQGVSVHCDLLRDCCSPLIDCPMPKLEKATARTHIWMTQMRPL